jgi:nicotinamide-nucleotide amidase
VAHGMELGYCARPGQVDVRLAMRGSKAEAMVTNAEAVVRGELGNYIYGMEDETLESVVVRVLRERKLTLASAESCTGGAIANKITNVPGASEIFLGGFVTYSNGMKEKFLGVEIKTLEANGAVSEPVARAMAEGARRATGADFAVAVTGIAGPGGGSTEKPVGTVFIALASMEGTHAWKMSNAFDRETFKEITAQQALNFLRLKLG